MFGFANTMFSRNGTRGTTARLTRGITLFERRVLAPHPNAVSHTHCPPVSLNLSHVETSPLPQPRSRLLISASTSLESVDTDDLSDSMTSTLDGITEELQAYLDSFSDAKEPSYVDSLNTLGLLDTPEAQAFYCPVTQNVANKPVKVNGITFDYDILLDLTVAEDGTRKNPLTREDFYLIQIEPDYETSQAIFDYISVNQMRATVKS